MPKLLKYTLPIIGGSLVWLVYWLGGGDFERGEALGFTMFTYLLTTAGGYLIAELHTAHNKTRTPNK